MFPNPYLTRPDPLREFRKLSKIEQRKLIEAGRKRKSGVKVEPVNFANIQELIRIIEG